MDTKRLMLADDDGLVRATFTRGLRNFGYEVTEAASAEEAIEVAGNRPLDLAILDIRMPGLSGVDAAIQLAHFDVPVVFLSAFNDQQLVRSALEQGGLGYVVKPIDVPRIVPTIEAALMRAEELRELRAVRQRLDNALESSNYVNVMVGVFMERFHLTRVDAFNLLRRQARSERRKLRDLAMELLAVVDNCHDAFGTMTAGLTRKGK